MVLKSEAADWEEEFLPVKVQAVVRECEAKNLGLVTVPVLVLKGVKILYTVVYQS
jgi:hypothetical protein